VDLRPSSTLREQRISSDGPIWLICRRLETRKTRDSNLTLRKLSGMPPLRDHNVNEYGRKMFPSIISCGSYVLNLLYTFERECTGSSYGEPYPGIAQEKNKDVRYDYGEAGKLTQ
jgi:hypothetical protein